MKRRSLFLGLLTAAACASAPQAAQTPAPGWSGAPPSAEAGAVSFDAWLAGFRQRALAAGISRTTLDRELAGLTPAPQVARLDSSQPEFSKPVSVYVQEAVTPGAMAEGARKRAENPWLTEVERRYGVPGGVVVGIWGRETGYGKILGSSDVIQALATRIANGKSRFEPDLIAALRLIDRGELTRAELKGSWAGAWGQTQFMPTNIEALAVDADRDGKRDLKASTRDALTSTANYLQQKGWRRGGDWTREVILPARFDYGVAEEEKRPLTWWAAQGVRRADGRPWADPDAEARLLLPAGANGPAFLAFDNYDVILSYNRSMAYALAVGLLADGAEGGAKLVRAWPTEQPLPRSEIVAAQATLRALGFDPGSVDGQVGADTRKAVRAWQKARGRPADGYLSAATVAALKSDTGRRG